MMSARLWVICSGARRSTMHAASRSATRSRCWTSRNAKTPPSDDSNPPSNLTTTDLPETDDQTGQRQHRIVHGGCGSPEVARIGFDNQILHEISRLGHSRLPTTHNAG